MLRDIIRLHAANTIAKIACVPHRVLIDRCIRGASKRAYVAGTAGWEAFLTTVKTAIFPWDCSTATSSLIYKRIVNKDHRIGAYRCARFCRCACADVCARPHAQIYQAQYHQWRCRPVWKWEWKCATGSMDLFPSTSILLPPTLCSADALAPDVNRYLFVRSFTSSRSRISLLRFRFLPLLPRASQPRNDFPDQRRWNSSRWETMGHCESTKCTFLGDFGEFGETMATPLFWKCMLLTLVQTRVFGTLMILLI